MHRIEINPINVNNEIQDTQVTEPGLVLGHWDEQLIKVYPQVSGVGYGLTICDMNDRTLLEVPCKKRKQPGHIEGEVYWVDGMSIMMAFTAEEAVDQWLDEQGEGDVMIGETRVLTVYRGRPIEIETSEQLEAIIEDSDPIDDDWMDTLEVGDTYYKSVDYREYKVDFNPRISRVR